MGVRERETLEQQSMFVVVIVTVKLASFGGCRSTRFYADSIDACVC